MRYVLRKMAAMAATLVMVSVLSFLAFQVIPGDPAVSRLGTQATPEKLLALQEEMGLNDPIIVRYVRWMADFVTGDMGTSYSYSLPVRSLLAGKLPVTLCLAALSFVMIVAVSLPFGILGVRYGGWVDRVLNVVNQLFMAVPPFFAGILITWGFGLTLRLFTPGGYVSYETSPAGFFAYLVFPAVAMALPRAAMTVRLLRDSVVKEAKKDYVRTAYSRGNRTTGVLYRHVLKNAMIPIVTFLAMSFADMVAESIVIEQVFAIPGLGRMLITSISNRDYPVVQAIVVCIAFIVVLMNFLADMAYRLIDPRIAQSPSTGGTGS